MQDELDTVMDDFMVEVNRFFNGKKDAAKAAIAATEMYDSLLEDSDHNIPLNVYLNADGSKTWVLAIPGKTKDDVTIVQSERDGRRVITVEVKGKTLSDEEKKAVEGRTNIFMKIKGMNGMKFSAVVPEVYDLDNLKAKVENGLLTITIPKVPCAQPREFTIE